MKRRSLISAFTCLTAVPACFGASGAQSALDASGALAQQIEGLWWYMFWVLGGAYLLTMIFLLLAIVRGRKGSHPGDPLSRRLVVVFGTVIPFVAVCTIFGYSIAVGRSLSVTPFEKALHVEVTGHQWWWEVRYKNGDRDVAVTANEIYIPAGVPVKLRLLSRDVIHSFWVPNLSGKMDAIPGRKNDMWLTAGTTGVWRGQCAEFCGAQHAHMSLEVISVPRPQFDRWLEWQGQSAVQPQSEDAKAGMKFFLDGPCALCHSIGGTTAHASFGPDLTHLAARRMIAAGTRPNRREHLQQWTKDAQSVKPGTRMPRIELDGRELAAIVSYLEELR
jgi:cytochrome c oxidase subunit II